MRGGGRWAVGAYACIVSEPKLYLEGNQRTGALIMSYILARDGYSPFVLGPDNMDAYFGSATLIKGVRRHGFAGLIRLPWLKARLARLLRQQPPDRCLFPVGVGPSGQKGEGCQEVGIQEAWRMESSTRGAP